MPYRFGCLPSELPLPARKLAGVQNVSVPVLDSHGWESSQQTVSYPYSDLHSS